MRTKVKIVTNKREIEENKIIRREIILHNIHNPYNKFEVPPFVEEEYETTFFGFKVQNILNYYTDPTEDKDIIINLQGYGEISVEYNHLVESKLEVVFHGE